MKGVASEVGFSWNPVHMGWSRPGLLLLSNLAGPIQHFKAAILDAWRSKVAAGLCGRKGFRGGQMLDIHGSLQLLNSSHVRERDKALLRSIMVGGVWNGFLLGRVRSQVLPCRFCGAPDNDGHLFWECTFPPLVEIRENPVEIRENPEFHDLMRMDKAHWPRCLLWHGWLPMLSGVIGVSPWAAGASECAFYLVETALGWYSSSLLVEWVRSEEFSDAGAASLAMSGRMVALFWIRSLVFLLLVLGFLVASLRNVGVGVVGVVLNMFGLFVVFTLVGGFCSVPVPMQSVQRAEMWGVSFGSPVFWCCAFGVDNLGVVRHVGRLLDGHHGSVPFELVKNGDLLFVIQRMLRLRGLDTVQMTKVKGHADDGMVLDGRVREIDRLGNDAADEAADFGRREVGEAVIDARRNLSGVCSRWYPVLLDLHRFFIAISGAVVNHDGMILWFGLLVPSPKDVGWFMRFGTGLFCMGRRYLGF